MQEEEGATAAPSAPDATTGEGMDNWLDELCRLVQGFGITCPPADEFRRALRGDVNSQVFDMLKNFGTHQVRFQKISQKIFFR
jgi:hypothetical protein